MAAVPTPVKTTDSDDDAATAPAVPSGGETPATEADGVDDYDAGATVDPTKGVLVRGHSTAPETPQSGTTTLQPPGEPGPCIYKSLPGAYQYETHLTYWTVDEKATDFWDQYGKAVATKNLWISVGNLTLAFSVWLIWSIVVVMINESWLGSCGDDTNDDCFYSFTSWKEGMEPKEYKSTLLILPATAGLSGATLRLTSSFMIAPSGGRNVISQTSILLLLPMIILYILLNNVNVDFTALIVVAWLTGAGGGAFSSSMSNITLFYPKSKQGLALALNAGIGNLGVSLMQVMVPAAVSYAAFGESASIYIDGVGYIANAALIWVPFLVVFIILAWLFMNSLPQHENAKYLAKAMVSFYWLQSVGYIAGGVAVAILIGTRSIMSNPGLKIFQAFMLWIIAVVITVLMMKYLMCCGYLATTKQTVNERYKILSLKHTWIMAYLYTMTFGSFIGFSATFPALIEQLYPGVDKFAYAWLGPFVGSVIRPFGGILSDKVGGARVTHWIIIAMILIVFAVGLVIAFGSEDMFPLFLILFLLLFVATGVGNASTFKMVPVIFSENKKLPGPVLGWIGAIAAYGAFVVPIIFGASVEGDVVEWVFFTFAIWYGTCLVINWWFYYRKGAEKPC